MNQLDSIRLTCDLEISWLREFVGREIIPAATGAIEDNVFELPIYKRLHEKGFLQLATPKLYGGPEASTIDVSCLHRELGYGSGAVSVSLIGNLLGYSAVVLFATEQLREKVCREYLTEFSLWSFAMSEADVGSDLNETMTTAREVTGGYRIDGEKNFITNASHSKHVVVFAKLIDRAGVDRGVTAFYVPGGSEGLTRGAALDKMSWRKADTGTILFSNVFVPEANLLGDPGDGLKILGKCLNRSKIAMAATGVGMATRAFDLATDRMRSTRRFKKALIDQGVVRQWLVQIAMRTEAAWLLVCKASAAWDTSPSSTAESSMAKLYAGSLAVDAASKAVELFGTRGLLNQYEVSRLYRDSKVLEIIEGPTFIQEALIAREILPKPEPVVARVDNDRAWDRSAKKRAA